MSVMLSGLRNFALTFAISALIFGVIAYFVVGFVTNTINETVPTGADIPQNDIITSPVDSGKTEDTAETQPTEPELAGESFTMLIIGTDYQPGLFDDYDYEEKWTGTGFPDKRNRPWGADTILLLRVDKENRQFVFCPIPRNTRVSVDGEYIQLGDAISKKNIDYLCGKVAGLTGLNIDYYVNITVESIAAMVDAVDEIEYYVPCDMVYSDPTQSLNINLQKGTQKLNGAKAAQLLRYVGYENGNTGRMATSVDFLKAIFKKFTADAYLTKAINLYNCVRNNVTTNFTSDDLANNLELIFSYHEFESVTVTYPGTSKVYDGITYFEPSLTGALGIFDKYTK